MSLESLFSGTFPSLCIFLHRVSRCKVGRYPDHIDPDIQLLTRHRRNPISLLDYARLLWDEKEIKSVANVTRKDVQDFLPLAAEIPIIPEVQEFGLEEANEALVILKQGEIQGAAVLRMH